MLMDGDEIDSVETAESGKLAYADMVNFWNGFDPYNLTALIASPDMAAKILGLSEMRDSAAGLSFHSTGKLVTPFGAGLIKSASVPAGTVIGIDSSCALEQVQAGGVVTEFDKLIDRQLERAAVTATAGFAKIYTGASKALTA